MNQPVRTWHANEDARKNPTPENPEFILPATGPRVFRR